MKTWLKKMALNKLALDEMKDRISDLQEQAREIRFRKPWIRKSEEPSRLTWMMIGAGLAWAASVLYKNRTEVAAFWIGTGARLKRGWESSGLKEKAQMAMGRVQERGQEAMASAGSNGQEPSY